MGSRQSFIIGAQRHPPADTGRPIPIFMEIFHTIGTRRLIGEAGEHQSALAVADGLKIDGRRFDNRRRVSVVKTVHMGKPCWLLTALPEGQDVRDNRVAANARARWLTQELAC